MTVFYGPAFEAALSEVAANATVASLHSAQPNASGSNELAGSGYARQSVTWGTASGGSLSSTSIPTFTVPASTTVTHVGFWDSGETVFYGALAFDVPEEYGAAGELTVDPATLTAATDPS
ncbi:phage tail fiber protein [Streptomonospora wellingtoniae]|uniref:Uncharacterized protein n=1 Tax=Streptomonospora wellingtoniae TaxID=3075544 RepID=A0ABU2L0G8_9ACTN|nr:hypothetical protein [Streptomonospora sp. DSM 45055]MDT0305057.1 hypothetical protein [Streptomonospora sp. DSM 45055]